MEATYSPEDNKLRLRSSSRLDTETYTRVKAAGFIWAPKQELFVAPMWTPDRADLLTELCGEIGDEDTSLVDRAEERADRFSDYSDKRATDAKSAHDAVTRIADGIPFGQPILVGHHSERHARKDAEKIENGMRKAVKMWETSGYWKSRAAGAIRHAKYKELPAVRARRIKGLEADKRKQERNKQEADMWLKLWTECEKEQDKELQKGVALRLANLCGHMPMPRKEGDRPDFNQCPDVYTVLTNSYPNLYAPRTLKEVFPVVLSTYPRILTHCERWIAHISNRLDYERAMLDEAGESHRLDKKPRPKQLPLCNYRVPEGLDIGNIYHRGEMIHYPQIEMTQAEYAAINVDYKGTRVVGNSHRVRTAMRRHELVCVFLTDSKVHERPQAIEPKPPVLRDSHDIGIYAPKPAPESNEFDAMKDTLRAGVQVVSAPQLFPTPVELAARMVKIANVQPGETVLEPSAGTGNIVRAVVDAVDTEIVGYEINPLLVSQLTRAFPSYKLQARCEDFLAVTEGQGQFAVVLMNPPFANGADIQHIEHAMKFLKPGGRLVAICANGPRQQERLRPILDTWETLPAATFKSSGTSVNTAIVTYTAPENGEGS